MIEEQEELDIIDLAYCYLIAAFSILGDADLFEMMSKEVSIHYDEYIENEYGQSILDLCHGNK